MKNLKTFENHNTGLYDNTMKDALIQKLMSTKYKDDDPKYDSSTVKFLNTLSIFELRDKIWRYENYEKYRKNIDESINFKEVDNALARYKTREDITKWVENFLDNAEDYNSSQQDLLEYITDELYDDKLRLLWTDIIQGEGH